MNLLIGGRKGDRMDVKATMVNKPLPDQAKKKLDQIVVRENEQLLFAVVSDMNLHTKYEDSVFAVTNQRIITIDSSVENEFLSFDFESLESIFIKRMYGNALVNIQTKAGEKKSVLRFTYTVIPYCDAAVTFVSNVLEGRDMAEQLEYTEHAYQKLMHVCPKCGHWLVRPGAECLNCGSKRKIISKLAKYVAPQKWTLIFCIFLSLITTAIALIPPYATSILVDDVLPNKDKTMLMIIVIGLLISYVIQYTINGFKGFMLRKAGDKIVMNLRNDVFEKAQKLPMSFYDKTSTGSVINRISGDTTTLNDFMLRISQEVIVQFCLMVGIIVIMLVMNWKLTLLSLIPIPFVVIGSRKFGRMIAPYYRKTWRKWVAVSSVLTDAIPCIRVVKAFAGEKRTVKKFQKLNEEWRKNAVKTAKISNTFPVIVSFVITCGSLLIWSVGGSWVINFGESIITIGTLVAFISYTSTFYGPVNFFANLNDSYQNALNSVERLFDILDAEPEPDNSKGELLTNIEGRIEFRNVNFSFDKTKKTLEDINFVIEPGDVVGIVGTTGSGKSTLINLFMRYYDNYEGEILLDGKNIRDIDMESFRSSIGYVQQEPMMFSDTIFNNIAYGVPSADVESVIHAADVANAHSFILNQPDAYDTVLGERGVGLSGGEKQRLSIARAVLKNPKILIFDEATAAVDSETESLIQEAIERLITGRTTLMIAHRLSTLRKANKIIVVDGGKIIEFGSPEELMALNGKYRRLIEIQSMSEKLKKTKEEENFD